MYVLVALVLAQGSTFPQSETVPDSSLSEGFSSYFDQSYARSGPRHNVRAYVAEDGQSVWVLSVGSSLFKAKPSGWHRFSLPGGASLGRELFSFAYLPVTKRVQAYTLSQGRPVLPAIDAESRKVSASEKARWRLTRDSSAILGVLDNEKVLTVTEGPAWDPVGEGAATMMAAAVVDITARGPSPNKAAYVNQRLATVGRTIGASLKGSTVSFVQAVEGAAAMYRYDINGNRLTGLPAESKAIPIAVEGQPLEPQLYDFTSGRVFYDFATPTDRRAGMWREFDLRNRRWLRFSPPKGNLTSAFYSRGQLYAGSRVGSAPERLYVATSTRQSWKDLGPFVVHGRSMSGKWWLVQRSTDRKLMLAMMP